MVTLKAMINDRGYTQVHFVDANTLQPVDSDVDPVKNKLFNQDILSDNTDGSVSILHSSVRSMKNIPGVLVLEKNKTYGKRKGKLLYKCIPDDRRLPIFLITYKMKYAFNKNIGNKYIVFTYLEWNDKHPIASIKQVIGDVDQLYSFYEYQLYCKSLYASIQDFTKKTIKLIREKSEEKYIQEIKQKYKIENREDRYIFSIDPKNSKDFDDAFGFKITENKIVLSIYISNVFFWMDIMDLWSSFTNRIATIYLPDRKRPMLPTVLSDTLCSLIKDSVRFAFTFDIVLDAETFEILEHSYTNSSIIVKDNFVYDTEEQESSKEYIQLLDIVGRMNKKYNYLENINTSHDLVAYLMVLMNNYSAMKLKDYKCGLFRSFKLNKQYEAPDMLPKNIQKFLKIWNSNGSKYSKFDSMGSHDMMNLDAYVHITSPIRRLPDLLTMMVLQDRMGLCTFTNGALDFYNYWISDEKIEYINKTLKSIRKVQNDCQILKLCTEDKGVMSKVYEGYIFDKIIRNDKLFQYIVYINELKMINRFTSRHELTEFDIHEFKLYLFTNETTLKKKVRIEML
jgi:exoribonuclease R